jgi:hypothetical protein
MRQGKARPNSHTNSAAAIGYGNAPWEPQNHKNGLILIVSIYTPKEMPKFWIYFLAFCGFTIFALFSSPFYPIYCFNIIF